MDVGNLVKLRIALDDRIKLTNKGAKLAVEVDRETMTRLDGKILHELNELGVDSLRTEFGTVSKNNKESFTVKDRMAFIDWVKENDMWHLLPGSINAADAREFMKENGGTLPPGVKYNSFIVPGFRRPNKKVGN